jgi:hypothetical protein
VGGEVLADKGDEGGRARGGGEVYWNGEDMDVVLFRELLREGGGERR